MALSKEDILKAVEELTVVDLVDLIKLMEDKFGVSAATLAAPAAVAAAPAAEEAAAEQSEFDVVLSAIGDKKINVIKVVRAITDLGLKEAKDLVESAPAAVKEKVSKDDAEDAKKQLEEAGAQVEIK